MRFEGPGAANEVRQALSGQSGPRFWKSLEEFSRTEAFQRFVADEFPALASRAPVLGRRTMLKLIGASLALAGLSACKGEEDEKAFPYVNAPEGVTVGIAKWFATAICFAGYAQPVLGKTFTGRPVKLEGNPDHPVSKGATDAFTQMALLGLYDPARSQGPLHVGLPADWTSVQNNMASLCADFDRTGGEGFRILIGPSSSPTLARQLDAIVKRWPNARWHLCDPVSDPARIDATTQSFGRALDMKPAFEEAATIVSFGEDFLGPGPHQTANARRFADRRRLRQSKREQCSLFTAEPDLSMTGSASDQRIAAGPQSIAGLMLAVAARLGVAGVEAPSLQERYRLWCNRAADALETAGSQGLVLVGSHYPADCQRLGYAINAHIGSLNRTLRLVPPVRLLPLDGTRSLETLVVDMNRGNVSSLLMLGTNPVYTCPGDLDFAKAMSRVSTVIHAGLHVDETAAISHWHVPLQHDLESWSDARAVDGSIGIIQPLVRPFYDVRSGHSVLDMIQGGSATDRELVRQTWQNAWGASFEDRWRHSLDRGFVAGSAYPAVDLDTTALADLTLPATAAETDDLTLVLKPDASVWDGALSENAWAQELPRPFTKITWGNVLEVSSALASKLSLKNGDEVRVTVADRSVLAPVFIAPGQDANTITASLGYGRTVKDSIADGLGFNAYRLRSAAEPWHCRGARIEPTGRTLAIASTQLHQAIDGFDFIHSVKLGELNPDEPKPLGKIEPPSLYPDRPRSDPSWGMSIDLDLCIGCNACVSACQAENNIPVVGKELVSEGREMQWLRIDHYFEGPVESPSSYFQPVPCMHCEQAPCEMGCPVNATVHSIDGLNLQVYNRCIGTRTCSSYCPYKVRRFNWFDFTQNDPEPVKAMRNPDVTVRSRGVMEKCTYCVQRIAEARITADKEGRPIRDGEIVTACQQACPSQAISFGNVADPTSEVSKRKAGMRDYALLEEANTRPRTTYLARIEDDGQAAEAHS